MRVVTALGGNALLERIRFVTASGQPAAIGALTEAADILAGRAGTIISATQGQARPSRSSGGSGQ